MMASKSVSKRQWPSRRVVLTWLAATLIAIGLSLTLGDRMRRGVFDSWQAARPRDLSTTDVRVVMIDDRSIEFVGPWPWPRYYLARLTEELAARKAKVIAYDMVFPEHDRVRPDIFVSLYPELSPGAAAEVKALAPMDELFGRVIGASPVVLAHAGVEQAPAEQPPVLDAPVVGPMPHAVNRWPAELADIPELDDVALGHGLINVPPDKDGVIRSVPLVMLAGGKARPGFAAEIARIAKGAEKIVSKASSVRIDGSKIPVNDAGHMRFQFGAFPPARVISAAAVLGDSKQLSADEFAGKIVLVGVTAEGSSDIVATPITAEEFGPLVQAQAVDAILTGGWLNRPAWVKVAEWAAAALLALLALANAVFGRIYRLALAAIFLAMPIASWLAFDNASLLFDPARPLLVGGGGVAGVAIGLFALARKERQRLRETLVQERIIAAEAEGELQAARAIQLGMVPPRSRLRSLDPRVDLDALLEPAKSVGGDFYDALMIDKNRLGFAVGDVTGKGVPAALFMAMSKALTSAALSRMEADASTIASAINAELLKDNSESMSVAMLLGILDLTTGNVSLVCAGNEDPLLLGADSAVTPVRLEGGPPFCVADFAYPLETLSLKGGETLILITDGVTEAQNAKGSLFGRNRLPAEHCILSGSSSAICEQIRDRVRRFEEGTEATDDLTVMALRLI